MKVVFFDGYCNLCNGFVNLLIKLDKKSELKFAFLQSEHAKKMIRNQVFVAGENPTSIVYLRNEREYQKSTAVLLLLWDLKNWMRWTAIFFVIPTFIRDFFYKIIASVRYPLFGKQSTCRIPTQAEQSKFL